MDTVHVTGIMTFGFYFYLPYFWKKTSSIKKGHVE